MSAMVLTDVGRCYGYVEFVITSESMYVHHLDESALQANMAMCG